MAFPFTILKSVYYTDIRLRDFTNSLISNKL